MPIRFRCAFCQQLLGIARRKSGSVINCPTCGGPLVVPREAEDQPSESPDGGAANRLLEDYDVDVLLKPPVTAHAVTSSGHSIAPNAAPAPAPTQNSGLTSAGDLESPAGPPLTERLPPGQLAGFLVTPRRATVAVVLIVLLLAAAFVAGFLLGSSS